LKEYLKCLTWENDRTVFEVRTNMLKLNSNYEQRDEECYIRRERETTKHIFEYKGRSDDKLTTEKYNDLLRKGGPQVVKMNRPSISHGCQDMEPQRFGVTTLIVWGLVTSSL